ncbi:MAG TPA: biopolymer transporter ExbD [Bryobacterales bacterium]|nr:biopolymer transporter ExbD [Bryobacterales bacterium]
MAFSTRGRGDSALADINVTPFVDIVLVLLIIFMITAHVMEYGVDVDVPRTRQVQDTSKELPVINVSKEGQIFLNADPVNINELDKKIEPMLGKDRAAYLRCDKEVVWEIPVQVMSELEHAKVKVSVVTQPLEAAPKKK